MGPSCPTFAEDKHQIPEGKKTMRKDRMKGEQWLMGANEAAKYLGLSHWTLRELIWSEAIPIV
jgi:hypothetical protein